MDLPTFIMAIGGGALGGTGTHLALRWNRKSVGVEIAPGVFVPTSSSPVPVVEASAAVEGPGRPYDREAETARVSAGTDTVAVGPLVRLPAREEPAATVPGA